MYELDEIPPQVALFQFNFPSEPHLLLHTVPSVHVFNVIEKVADGVHEAEMLTVLVHCLEHLIEGHSNLSRKGHSTRLHQGYMISLCLWSNVSVPPACTVSSLAGNAAETAPPGDTRTAAGTLSERWASASPTGIYKAKSGRRCRQC